MHTLLRRVLDARSLFIAGLLCSSALSLKAQDYEFFNSRQGFTRPIQGNFGTAIDSVGDINGDGFDDLIAMGTVRTAGASSFQSRAQVFDGRRGDVLYTFESANFTVDPSVTGAGDVNGDGVPDLAYAAPPFLLGVAPTPISVHSGADGSLIRTLTTSTIGLQISIANADANGDGYEDLIACSSGSTTHTVEVFSGRDGTVLHTVSAPVNAPNATFSSERVTGVPDIDGDGRDEFAFVSGTAVEVHSGADASVLLSIPLMGIRDVCTGDFNGDGIADLGTSRVDGRGANVHSGADGSLLFSQSTGNVVDMGGDVNGDGFDDLLIGTTSGARVEVVSGADQSLLISIQGGQPSRFGADVAIHDANGDGYGDMIVGAPDFDGRGIVHWFGIRNPRTTAIARPFDAGCENSAGQLARASTTGRPFLGQTFSLNLRGAPSNANPGVADTVLLLGFRSLPIDLSAIGFTDCRLHVSPNGSLGVPLATDSTGQVSVAGMRTPTDSALTGREYVAQWIVGDTGAPGGATLSNAIRLVLGQ